MNVLIAYYTKTGHTLEAATAVAEGIRAAGGVAELVSFKTLDAAAVGRFDGVIVASPCWSGSVTRSGVPKRVARALRALPADALKGKRCGGISVHSATGGKTTVRALGTLLGAKGADGYIPGPVAKAWSPLSLWTGPVVGPEDAERFRAYGAAFATPGVGVSP